MNIKKIETDYYISDCGKVFSSKSQNGKTKNSNKIYWKELKQKTSKFGYKEVVINYKSKFVHRLVAEAFIPNNEKKPCVDHIDCDKSNNSVHNLRWCTYEENNKWRREAGRSNQWTMYGSKNKPII